MLIHNPHNQSRYSPTLGRNMEPFETVEVPDDFQPGDEMVVASTPPKRKARAPKDEE